MQESSQSMSVTPAKQKSTLIKEMTQSSVPKSLEITTTMLAMKFMTTILAVKEFQSMFICFLCKSTFTMTQETMTMATCSSCGGSFSKMLTWISNQCSVMLANHKWYIASASVSIVKISLCCKTYSLWLFSYMLSQLSNLLQLVQFIPLTSIFNV